MKKTAAVLCCCLWALGCGESTDQNDPPSTLDIVDDYLEDLKPLLQGLRALDEDIARAVPGDSVSSDVIVTLIEARFRPKLIEFAAQVQDPAPAPELTTVQSCGASVKKMRNALYTMDFFQNFTPLHRWQPKLNLLAASTVSLPVVGAPTVVL